MNIHELTRRILGVSKPLHSEEQRIHRLLLKSSTVTGYLAPGTGVPVNVSEDTARFAHLLHLLCGDGLPYGRGQTESVSQLARALGAAGAYGAPSGQLVVLAFRDSGCKVSVVTDEDVPTALSRDPKVMSWRIVRIP